jgi:iron only hydrogenase large subunit-like protein
VRPGPVYSEQAQCQDCYKCLRACPVKAIRVDASHAVVMPELCLACGACVAACPSGAKRVRDDQPDVAALLRSGAPVVVSLAPSYRSEFEGLDPLRLVAAIRRLGFRGVSETALGAQQVSARLARMLDRERGRTWISTACPAAVELVRTYLPERLDQLTPMDSPLQAHVSLVRARLGEGAEVVFIGPCIAKKQEAATTPGLAAALTFEDLRAWLAREAIVPEELVPGAEDRFLLGSAAEGALYPLEGGMAQATGCNLRSNHTRFVALAGLEPIRRALRDLPDPGEGNLFLELLACEGGCGCGPKAARRSAVRVRMAVLDAARPEPGACPREPELGLERRIGPRPGSVRGSADATGAALAAALRRLGKAGPEDELNCGGCGYDTCRELACAILDGRAEARMCVSNLRRLAEKKANALLRTLPFGVVIVDEDLRIIESNDQFVRLLGEEAQVVAEVQPFLAGARLDKFIDFGGIFRSVLAGGEERIRQDIAWGARTLSATIFAVEPGAVAGALLLDVTETEAHRRAIIGKAEEVIQNMLANAQDIAFSLGRNAARSEGILKSIIAEFRGSGGHDG